VNANKSDFPVRSTYRVLSAVASGFYAWRERAPSQRSITNAVITEWIRPIESQDLHRHHSSCNATHSSTHKISLRVRKGRLQPNLVEQ
jgi:hypothetical protein